MKNIITAIMLSISLYSFGQVGIGTPQPHEGAQLEIFSTTQGFQPPRLTTMQRDSITTKVGGLTIFNTDENCMQFWNTKKWTGDCTTKRSIPHKGAIASLDCRGTTHHGTLTNNTSASGVSFDIPYSKGNGGTYNRQTIASTEVKGLTATLASGTFANGKGVLTYTVTGKPTEPGRAVFSINIGGQTCSITVPIISNVSPKPKPSSISK